MSVIKNALIDCTNCNGDKCPDCNFTGFEYDKTVITKAPIRRQAAVPMKKSLLKDTDEEQLARIQKQIAYHQNRTPYCIDCNAHHKVDLFRAYDYRTRSFATCKYAATK